MILSTNKIEILRFLADEIIGEVISETPETVKVKNPLRIVVIPNKMDPQNPNVGFAPLCEWTTSKELDISKTMLLFRAEPIELFLKQYKMQTAPTGLVIPETKIIH
jgi:hypothetical protein